MCFLFVKCFEIDIFLDSCKLQEIEYLTNIGPRIALERSIEQIERVEIYLFLEGKPGTAYISVAVDIILYFRQERCETGF